MDSIIFWSGFTYLVEHCDQVLHYIFGIALWLGLAWLGQGMHNYLQIEDNVLQDKDARYSNVSFKNLFITFGIFCA